ncbi:S8 family serine peptidase [Actinoplanes sp. NPDC049265]|uniref:S8 family serine peptidase n=1 Tax=Actinoplanes sp. NPDC049265 TaxID=3363902 RepID=UPI003711334B
MSGTRLRRVRSSAVGGALLALALTAAGLSTPAAAAAATPKPSVSAEVLSTVAAKGSASFWVYLRERADIGSAAKIADKKVQGATVFDRLTSTAKESQSGVVALLQAHKAKFKSYWISNALHVTGDRELLDALATRADVAKIEPVSTFKVIEPVAKRHADKGTQATEWGLNSIKAPQVWSEYGVDGSGMVVANVDTGVDYTHPALKNKYRGLQADGSYDHNYNWFDPANICSGDAPCDNNSHGTHTMGTMVGSDGGSNQIGVAPGAKFIAAKGCETNSCSDTSLLAAAQWILAPTDLNGQNPRPDLRPDVVNNSWGGGRGDTWYQDAVQAWVAAGIFPAFSNGNSGSACNTAANPGDYPDAYAAGAYDSSGTIADFSSRGTSSIDQSTKPDIAAPGVNVRSSVPGGGYDSYDGTSMASPHVAGSVALLWSAAPGLERNIDATRALLDDSAVDTPNSQCGGTDDDNNVFGEGKLDVYKAVTDAPRGPVAKANGVVTDKATGRPIAGVTVTSEGRTVTTDAQGKYSLTLEAGTHDVTASKYGYVAETTTVTVEEGQLLALNFALTPAQMVKVTGKVTDGSGHGWPLYAKIEVAGRPGTPIYTDPATGSYSVDLPANTTYTVKATPVYPGYTPATAEVVVGTTPVTGNLVAKVAPDCTAAGYQAAYGAPAVTEDFSGASAPDGWQVVNRTDSGGWTFTDDGKRGNLTGGSGGFAIIDSDNLGQGNTQDTDLITKPLDLSGIPAPYLRFNSDFQSVGSSNPIDIDVSADNGASWTNVFHSTESRRGPRVEEISLAPVAAKADALVRFRYLGTWAWWWEIDNVNVVNRACTPIPGGLVVGNTTDSNTGAALNGVTVTSDDVPAEKAVSAVTPDDANLADGFYWLFSTATGSHGFTATKSPYTPAKKTVNVAANGAVRADFALGAGKLTVTPTNIESHQVYGSAKSTTVTVKNTGNAPATVTPNERSKGFEVLKSAESAAVVNVPVKGLSVANKGRTYATAKAGTAAADAWTAIPNVPAPIMDNAAVTAGGKVYSIGGGTDTGNETKIYVYDPAESTWASLAAMPHGRAKPSVAEYSGKLYVFGGWGDTGAPEPTVDVFDIAAGSWSTLDATNPKARAAAGTAVVNDKVYLVGGCVDGQCGPSVETVVFDPAAGAFSEVKAYPHPVSWTGCGGVGGQIVCAGGADADSGTFFADTQVYDPAGDSWTAGPNLPQNNFGAAATAAGGVLVYAGGAVNSGAALTNATLAYDPAAGAWTNLPAMAAPKYRAAASCGAYRLGGSSGGFNGTADAAFLDGLADCEGGGDISWLSTDADEGFTLAPGASRKIKVTLTATPEAGVLQPGAYTGQLGFRTDSPYAVPSIDVEMNVSPPASWGKVVGTVTGAACSGTVPLKATIRLNGPAAHTLVADGQGKYGWWLQRGTYQVIVAKDGYIPEVFTVKVNAGFVETTDFQLDPVVACSTRAAMDRRLEA